MTKIVTIRCFDSCEYNLLFPDYFMHAELRFVSKIFNYLFQFEYLENNQENISYLDSALTEQVETLCANCRMEYAKYQDEYQSTNRMLLISEYDDPDKEIKKRTQHNNALMKKVKEAEKLYKRAERVRSLYIEAKHKFYRS